MARYYIHTDDDTPTVLREMLEAADDPRHVVYLPGEPPNGAVEIPDDLADRFSTKDAAKVKADRDAEVAAYQEADAALRVAPGPDDPTLTDLANEAPKVSRKGRRTATKTPTEE
jgi:hypothetical protein